MENNNENINNMSRDFEPESATDFFVHDRLENRAEPESVRLQIDWRDGSIDVVTIAQHQMNSWSSEEWHGLVGVYQVNYDADAFALAEWVDENMGMLSRIHACFDEHWDGSNFVGEFDFDNDEEAGDFLEHELQLYGIMVESHGVAMVDAGDYFCESFWIQDGMLHTDLRDTPYSLSELGDEGEYILEALMDNDKSDESQMAVRTLDYAKELMYDLRNACAE